MYRRWLCCSDWSRRSYNFLLTFGANVAIRPTPATPLGVPAFGCRVACPTTSETTAFPFWKGVRGGEAQTRWAVRGDIVGGSGGGDRRDWLRGGLSWGWCARSLQDLCVGRPCVGSVRLGCWGRWRGGVPPVGRIRAPSSDELPAFFSFATRNRLPCRHSFPILPIKVVSALFKFFITSHHILGLPPYTFFLPRNT